MHGSRPEVVPFCNDDAEMLVEDENSVFISDDRVFGEDRHRSCPVVVRLHDLSPGTGSFPRGNWLVLSICLD